MTYPIALFFLAAICSLATSARSATIITFAGGTTNDPIPASFGDFVPNQGGVTGVTVTSEQGTPNIGLTWSATGSSSTVRWDFYTDSLWTGGVGQLNDAVVGTIYRLEFAPQAGIGVQINSFNFFSYYASSTNPANTNGQYSFDWAIVRSSDSSTVASGSTGLFTGGSPSPAIDINYTATDSQAYSLVLTRSGGAGGGANIAVDNISFGQVVVPEPSITLLGLIGAVSLLRRRRN